MSYGDKREKPSEEEMDNPIPKGKDLPPLPLLPEREWLRGKITNVEYRYVYFNGRQQFMTDNKSGEQVLDAEGKPIPRREFNIEISCLDFEIAGSKDKQLRKAWVRLGASLNKKANMPKFLKKLEMNREEDPSPREIIDYLTDLYVRFQLSNSEENEEGKIFQNVVWDAIKPDVGA